MLQTEFQVMRPPSKEYRVLLSHPTGNANVREALRTLEENRLLARFITSISWKDESAINKMLPAALKNQLQRRQFRLDPGKIVTRPVPEFLRLTSARFKLPWLSRYFDVDRIYRGIDNLTCDLLEEFELDAVYCYEDGALKTFQSAKAMGLRCFYDLPIAYWETAKSLLTEEAERLPQWARTIPGTNDSPEKLARKTEEAELADVIITPSQFVLNSLPRRIREEKECVVLPFGTSTSPEYKSRETPKNAPLRVLFAGSLTQRKGLADLFHAFQLVDSEEVELVVMGSLCAPLDFYRKEYRNFVYEPPRPHDKVLQLMSECDVFVLPSLVEGRALVQLEALSVGLPLIISHNTGGEDLLSEDCPTGFAVDIRNPQQIAEKVEWFVKNRSLIDEMKENCREHARKITWNGYRSSLYQLLSKFIK